MLLLLLLRVSLASIHIILGVNHKAVENMQRRLEEVRRKYVEKKEKDIVFQKSKGWIDVAGDEVTSMTSPKVPASSTKSQETSAFYGSNGVVWCKGENQKRSSLLGGRFLDRIHVNTYST